MTLLMQQNQDLGDLTRVEAKRLFDNLEPVKRGCSRRRHFIDRKMRVEGLEFRVDLKFYRYILQEVIEFEMHQEDSRKIVILEHAGTQQMNQNPLQQRTLLHK